MCHTQPASPPVSQAPGQLPSQPNSQPPASQPPASHSPSLPENYSASQPHSQPAILQTTPPATHSFSLPPIYSIHRQPPASLPQTSTPIIQQIIPPHQTGNQSSSTSLPYPAIQPLDKSSSVQINLQLTSQPLSQPSNPSSCLPASQLASAMSPPQPPHIPSVTHSASPPNHPEAILSHP